MSRFVDAAQLQQIPLFAQLEPALLEPLAAQSTVKTYAVDEVVFHEGDELPACLHVLMAGTLRIAKIAESGKETILRLLPAGEVFAAPALFGDGKAPATVTAMESAVVLRLEQTALLESFSQHPELALHLLCVFNQRLQQLHDRVHGLVSKRAIVRLVHYLEHVAADRGTVAVAAGERLRSPLTYYQIARSIGITYEECVRLFKQLQPAVTYQRGGVITIANRQQLTEKGHELI
ncbi:MAG: Crp/Fnr family transcriptional regulator [Leptolyngbya sp. SIO1E4]|nr:Crp/Fnr family transcriptional regulator [Leptolyngbya sp. SIO1E4]